MSKGINYTKVILTGIVWGFVYFLIFMPMVGYFFSFDFLSGQEWQSKWKDFIDYKWLVKTKFDFALLMTMILWIPVFFVFWWLLCKINWGILKPKAKPRTVVKKVLEIKENKQTYAAPRALPSAIKVRSYVSPKLPSQQEEKTSGQKSHTNLVQMIRSIATIAKKYQVEIFQHILLEGNRVPLAISTDARAVMIEIVNKKNVNWSVEFTDDIMKSSWYCEGGTMESLAQDLLKASASLARSEPNSEILSAIVLTDGRILNAKQTADYFEKHGIFLLSFNNGEPKSDLRDLPSFLSAYFDLKDGETDPAPHPVEKVPIRVRSTVSEEETTEPQDEPTFDSETDEMLYEQESAEQEEFDSVFEDEPSNEQEEQSKQQPQIPPKKGTSE